MNKLTSIIAISLLAIAGGAAQAEQKSGLGLLAEILDDRIAEEPKRCIPSQRDKVFITVDRTALVYGSGRTVYVNFTQKPEDLSSSDLLVFEHMNGDRLGNLCRHNKITKVDTLSGAYTGSIILSDFIPFTRPDEGADDS